MFVLAHLSDLHLASRPKLSELAGKRALGFINWQRKRKFIHRPETLDAIVRDVTLAAPDHIAVTGDLVNLSLADEYRRARALLETLGPADNVTVIPGNHDAYVRGALETAVACWGDYMRGDDKSAPDRFPFLRRRGDVALIALSTAVPTGPFMATGRLDSPQLHRLAQLLDQTHDLFRIVLIHHPPSSPPRRYLRRLTDGAQLRRTLAQHGAELLLHGHDHRRALLWLDGPGGTKIPAIGVPSASANAPHGDENGAGYNLFRIEKTAAAWRCEMIGRERDVDGVIRDSERQILQ